MSGHEETPAERSYTELLRRLPQAPLPVGFRDAVMGRIARDRAARLWQWLVAAIIAVPNLAFLGWEIAGGGDLAAAFENVAAVLTTENWSGELAVSIDGATVIAVSLLGLAGMVMAHALASGRRSIRST